MLAAVQGHNQTIGVQQLPRPVPKAAEVLIRVMACAVSPADLALSADAATIPGHQLSGVVEQVGEEVDGLWPGDRVSVDPHRICGECAFCWGQLGYFCDNRLSTGSSAPGGMAQYCVVGAAQAHPIAPHTSFEQGAMGAATATCLHAVDLCALEPGSSVVVLGATTAGLLALQLAKLEGAAHAAVLDGDISRHQLAHQLGADLCLDPADPAVVDALSHSGFDQVNAVIDCSHGPHCNLPLALQVAGNGATVVLVETGTARQPVTIPAQLLLQKQLTIKAAHHSPYTHQRAVRYIDSGSLQLQPLLPRALPLSQLQAATWPEPLCHNQSVMILPQQ